MAKKRRQAVAPRAQEPLAACPKCGGTNLTHATSQNISCGECGYLGQPRLFQSRNSWQEFRGTREIARMPEARLWGQKVLHRTVPVVVLVNWSTALFFFTFFALGMLGWFRFDWFQWLFLYLSIAVVVTGLGILIRWGKERFSF